VLQRNVTPPAEVKIAEFPVQIVCGGQMVQVGPGVIVTVVEHELLQPLAFVTVTVYVVVTVGFTVMDAVVAALLHRNDTPPDAVSVDEPPTQLDGLAGVILQVGPGVTVTIAEHELVQPLASVTVTVYVVVTVGFTVIAAVVAALLHRNDTPPEAVSEVEPPTQIESFETMMLHTGAGLTVTVVEHELVQPLASVTVTV